MQIANCVETTDEIVQLSTVLHTSALSAVSRCLSVCLSMVTSRCSIEMTLLGPLDGSSWCWHVGFLRPTLHCVYRKFWYPQNSGASLWNVVQNSGLGKFRRDMSIVATLCQLSWKNADAYWNLDFSRKQFSLPIFPRHCHDISATYTAIAFVVC